MTNASVSPRASVAAAVLAVLVLVACGERTPSAAAEQPWQVLAQATPATSDGVYLGGAITVALDQSTLEEIWPDGMEMELPSVDFETKIVIRLDSADTTCEDVVSLEDVVVGEDSVELQVHHSGARIECAGFVRNHISLISLDRDLFPDGSFVLREGSLYVDVAL